MTTNRQMAGGRESRRSAPRIWAKPPSLALVALALVALIQAGCRSDGCSNCNLGSKLTNGVQALAARVTKHFDNCGGGADCGCGSGGSYGGETVIDSGTPVISGGMVYPAPGALVPPPTIEQAPSQLEPIPSTTSGSSATPSSNRTTPSGNNRSSYTTMAPKGNLAQRRGSEVSRALLSNSETSTSASTDLLDNLPPVEMPSEVTKNATPAVKPVVPGPSASPSASAGPPAVVPAPVVAPAASPVTETKTPTPTPAEKLSAAEGAVGLLPTLETPSAFQAPGIRRHGSVAPSLAGGSAPSTEGLDWLKERGCRTFIDLRKPSEVEPNFVDAVSDRNMVYISLPIMVNRLEPSRLARFDDLISRSENLPLYFCDTDGTRAGLVWYIHLRVVGQEDAESASGKAAEIGLTEVQSKLAEAYLTVHKPKPRAATARVASVTPDAVDVKHEPTPEPPVAQAPRSALPDGPAPAATGFDAGLPGSSSEPTPPMLPGEDRPQASRFRDPAFWRPVAALVLTALGVPLAYWSRSALTVSKKPRARGASLTGSVRPPTETPAASDA